MGGFVDLEKIAVRSDRALARLDREQTRELERYLGDALRRTLDQTRPLYARAMQDVDGTASNAAFRLARGRVLADELDGTVRGLVGQPDGALEGLLARTAAAREQARDFVEDTLGVFGDAVTISTPVNHRALSGVVENAATRLYLHAEDTVDRIKSDVVTGLVRGDSWTQVTRAIREDTGYLRYRAERIALTELHSAQADARQELYGELGVELVIRYVTIDDRTCEYCAPRQGEVTRASETTEVLHPFCRCILAPFDPEWALDDTLVPEQLEEMLSENLAQLDELGITPNLNAAPFERVRDRQGFRIGPVGRGRPKIVWRPGQSTDRLTSWLGRSFTNLAPHVRNADGVTPSPPAGAPTDPVEQARVLPKQTRDRLRNVDQEAAGLRAESERLTGDYRTLNRAYREHADVATARSSEARALDSRLARVGSELDRTRLQLQDPRPWNDPPDVLRARLAELTGRYEQLERDLRAARAVKQSTRTRADDIFVQLMDARTRAEDAEDALRAFRRTRAQEIIANAATGHQNGSVPIKTRMRDATLRERVETASTWLSEHTTLKVPTPTEVKRLRRGARAYQLEGRIHLAPGDGTRIAVHELGHAIDQAHPSLAKRAVAYRETRTAGEKLKRLRDVTGNSGYDLFEVAKCDKFIDCYMGKFYPGDQHTEVLSMGLEYMYDDPIGFAQKDPTTFDFILRIMKGLPDP